MVHSPRRFVLCLTLCHIVLVFFSPSSIAITSLGEERANLSAFRMLVRFVLVWICRLPLPFGVWEGLWFVIVALPGLFSYIFCDCVTPWTFLLPLFNFVQLQLIRINVSKYFFKVMIVDILKVFQISGRRIKSFNKISLKFLL